MADLNALIAQGVQFKAPPDPFAQYAQMQQLQRGEETGRMNQLLMQEKQRGFQEQNALRGVVSRPGFDPMNPTHAAEAMAAAPTLAAPYIEKILTTRESRGKITAADIKAKSDREGMLAQAGRDMAQRPDNENIISHNRDVQGSDLFTPDEKARVQARADMLLALPMDQRAAAIGNPGVSAGEVSTAATALAGQIAAAENARLGRGTTERGQDIAARTAAAVPTVTQIVDPTNANQMITIDARRYQGGGAGSPGVIGVAGKEPGAALRQNKTEIGRTQLADDLDNLRASFRTLNEMRAIPSTERNVLSNLGSATAATGVGQMFGRAGGTEAQVERDVINSARMRLVNSIKNATGMSAQQLNSNVELQTMLKSISDPGQSVQAAMRIIDDIENAYVKGDGKLRKSGKVTPAAAAGQNALSPAEQTELDQLRKRFGGK